MDIKLTVDPMSVCRQMASSRHNRTTLAANHDRYRTQMVVISECANVRECSRGSWPIPSCPHSEDPEDR